jgi:hypothetical protein
MDRLALQRQILRASWKVAMNSARHLRSIFAERKQALLDELRVVEMLLLTAQPCEETREWIEQLKRWRDDMQTIIEDMPDFD